jgi:hypothetical protein
MDSATSRGMTQSFVRVLTLNAPISALALFLRYSNVDTTVALHVILRETKRVTLREVAGRGIRRRWRGRGEKLYI